MRGKMFRIVGVALAALLVAGGAFVAVTWYLGRDRSAQEASAGSRPPMLYDAGEFVTNLADQSSRRFIQVHIKLEVAGKETADELDDRSAVARDRILGILRSRTYAEVSGNEGMGAVGTDIVQALNRLLQDGTVLNIYFSQFIVQ